MKIIFYLLLMLSVGRCDQILDIQTVGVGDDVTLNCTRKSSGSLFWFRLISGDLPKVLGKTFSFETDPRITATEEPGFFVLRIKEAKLSDAAVYFCMKIYQNNITFLKGIDLRVKKPDTTAVRLADSVTLQCSVLSENKTCPGENCEFWFRVGSDETHPSVIYTHGNGGDVYEKSPESHSLQKCVYMYKNVSSSDDGTYYCALATCGEILFGNGTKLEFEGIETCLWSQNANEMIFLICGVQALSLIVIVCLIYAFKKKESDCYNAAVAVQKHRSGQQRDLDAQFYSAVVFTVMKTGCDAMKEKNAAERQRIYAAVKAFGLD
ncbi:uncharacterized protein LOC131982315 [Centropristis striata]|uniref:uncharacterized protein LOC131982315 n=1 Tax=Centropristis striata TaxID=184440 RepID=UPI0027E15ACB|nr:uncharacterized protein LOC131982315 [Centropristis striata]